MRLTKVVRTTSFRFTLLYAALFFISVLLLFGAVYWYGTGYVAGEIDLTVANELKEIQTSVDFRTQGPQRTVAKYAAQSPGGVYYLLRGGTGKRLAGNIPALDPVEGVREWSAGEVSGHFPRAVHSVRGRGVRLEDGTYLFVGVDSFELGEMRELVARCFIWGFLGTTILALSVGALMSGRLLRRVQTIANISNEIVGGDLSRRIPLRGSGDEFDHLANSLNAMLDRIEGLMEGLRQVSSDIAHDLRTPLTRLHQRLELSRRRSLTLEQHNDALDGSIADVDAILETFSALLRLAQIEARAKATQFALLDMSAMLREMADTYRSVAEEKEQTLQTAISPDLLIEGDCELLPQLFSNLIENAIRHSPCGSHIHISTQVHSPDIVITIADNGPGIPTAYREKAFQRFFRMEQSRNTEGTGLGLSLAAAIARLHGGHILLSENEPGLRAQVILSAPYKSC